MRTEVDIDDHVILEYVREEFGVEDVFSQGEIKECARHYYEPGDVFTNQQIKDYVGRAFQPGELFSYEELRQWAFDNGFDDGKEW